MECYKCRKNLREYAAGEIHDKLLLKEMEEHINECYICKKELLMWQELIEKQKVLGKMRTGMDLKDRLRMRMNAADSDMHLPMPMRHLKNISRAWRSNTGRLVLQVSIVLAGFIWVLAIKKYGVNVPALIFVLIGFFVMIFLMLKKR